MAEVGRRSGAALRGFGTVGARPLAALHRHLESAAGWPLAGCAGGLPHPDRRGINSALGTRQWLAAHAIVMEGSLFFGLLVFFSICGLRQMVRKDVPAAILAALLLVLSSGSVFTSPNWKLEAAISISVYSVLVFVLLRLGLVATMAAVFFIDSFNLISLGADWKTWYAPAGLATFFLLLGIAIFAFWRFARFARVVQRRRESLKEEVRRQKAE